MEKLHEFNIDCEKLYQEWYRIDHELNFDGGKYSRLLINSATSKTNEKDEDYYLLDAFENVNNNWYSVKKILKKFQNTYTQEVCLLVETWFNTINLTATRIKYAALYPGRNIEPHIDYAGYRFHMPITTNDKCVFIVGNVNYNVDSLGSMYRFDSNLRHSVANNGDSVRLHLMFDVRNLNG